jgi:hypothetical protein
VLVGETSQHGFQMMSSRTRFLAFAAIAVSVSSAAGWYVWRAASTQRAASGASVGGDVDGAALESILSGPHVLFRSTAMGSGYGRVAAASLSAPDGARAPAALDCDRVDFNGGTGVCLTADRGVFTRYTAEIFDASFAVRHSLPLAGIPSRVRVAPNGSLAAITVFVSGHSYAGSDFSTLTALVDTRQGKSLVTLEDFEVVRDGRAFKAVDFNFWGVTFAVDSDTFYATLNTGGVFYLVRGSATRHTATVIGEGVECPSLSPDNTRLAYKKRTVENGRMMWRLAIRPVSGGEERILNGEPRSVDDQVEWLDNARIVYAVADEDLGPGTTSVRVVDVDGGESRRWIANGFSPAVPDLLARQR